jgi:hypothetical protein
MFSVRMIIMCLFLLILMFVLVTVKDLEGDKRDATQAETLSPAVNSSGNTQKEQNEPTCENWWRAKQSGNFAEAKRIRAILDKEAKKMLGSRVDDDMVADLPGLTPPEDDNAVPAPSLWGDDVTIATGSVSGGISTDHDNDGNLYAVRCTTYSGVDKGRVNVYKSMDEGTSWHFLCGFYSSGASFTFSYPVVLTGTSGTPDKLYVFYLRSDQNGKIGIARFTQNGSFEGFYEVKADDDTITYFSVCTDLGQGDHLMLAYQKEGMGDDTPDLYTITSMDFGETWNNQMYVTSDGSHPDIAYGIDGYVYLTYESCGGMDTEINACKHTSHCNSVPWQDFNALTFDSFDDTYPKVAALHTRPADETYVWIAYNHHQSSSVVYDTLRYDDGSHYYFFQWMLPHQLGLDFFNVRFTPVRDCRLKAASMMFYGKAGSDSIRIYVWESDGTYPTQKIDSVDVPVSYLRPYPQWIRVDFSSQDICFEQNMDFHIGYTVLSPATDSVAIFSDDGEPVGTEHRSICYYEGAWQTMYESSGQDVNFMIRALVEVAQEITTENVDVRFAYSRDGGVNWSKDYEMANSVDYDEMACDLWTWRSENNLTVNACYLKYWCDTTPAVDESSYLCYRYASPSGAMHWHYPFRMSEHPVAWVSDGREVSQGCCVGPDAGIVFAGKPSISENFEDLYFDVSFWATCPEDRDDLGECDTLYIEPWTDDLQSADDTGPYQVRVPMYVTCDVFDEGDSISTFVMPFCYEQMTNTAMYCSVSGYWNNSYLYPYPDHLLQNSIFRHYINPDDSADTLVHNWMMSQSQKMTGEEWNTFILNIDGTSHFWLAMIPSGAEDHLFEAGSRILLMSMTFMVEDTMTVCLDTCFWPPTSNLCFVTMAHDCPEKTPRPGTGTSSFRTCFAFVPSDNRPPEPFALLFPPNKAFTPLGIPFKWETADDPDSSDRVTYDLYISTSYDFTPDETTIYTDLDTSDHAVTLDLGSYFWKVKAKDNWGAETWSQQFRTFIVTGIHYSTGDFNMSGSVDAGDVVSLIVFLYRSGPAPDSLELGDVNCDEAINGGDVVFLINYLFRGGPPPGC